MTILFVAGVVAANREGTELRIIADPKCRRMRATVDMPLAVNLFYVKMYVFSLAFAELL
jgi:hypothetical protein